MNLSKSYEFLQPEKVAERLHIVGCGSVGSTVAENLARCGFTKFTLWDFDLVEPHNIANQMFFQTDIGKPKVDAVRDMILSINPDAERDIKIEPEGWKDQLMSGYIFLCVDNIELRKEIVTKHKLSPVVKAVFDFRTMLTGAQHYAAKWNVIEEKESLINSMDFSHEEATEETPVSACGITLGVVTTVRLISALGVNNFINLVKNNEYKRMMLLDGFEPSLIAF